jgi:hypothetical protein
VILASSVASGGLDVLGWVIGAPVIIAFIIGYVLGKKF